MPRETISYKNDEIKVIWKPAQCIHSRICWTQLRSVFNPSRRPWVNMEGGDTATIVEQVKKCPSGALSFEWLDPVKEFSQTNVELPTEAAIGEKPQVIECLPDGPLIVEGKILIKNSDGSETLKTGELALCRCGGSSNKPYCDGTHYKNGFKG